MFLINAFIAATFTSMALKILLTFNLLNTNLLVILQDIDMVFSLERCYH